MGLAGVVREALEAARDLVLPPRCCGCGRGIPARWWCAECEEVLPWIRAPRCEVCSQPFDGAIEGVFRCPNCGGRGFHFECAVAAVRSRGAVRHLIHAFKYGRATWAVRPLALLAARGLEDPRLKDRPDVLVPVPLHPLRQRERGYNQSELLARELARLSGLPVKKALRRARATVTQTHFDRARRIKNLRGAFEARAGTGVRGARVLLIDDVLTTGSTFDECARTLLESGAVRVQALAAARG